MSRLRKTSAMIKFVTNTTKESKNRLHRRLTTLGFDIEKSEIFSSLAAARETILMRKLKPLLLLDPAAMEDFQDMNNGTSVDKTSNTELNAVVVGLAPDKFHYDQLNQAFRCNINS